MEVAEEAMGNVLRLCTTANKSRKSKSKKNNTGSNTWARNEKHVQAHEDTPAYDEVTPEVPVYAVVNKKKPEDVHYAELQMIQQGTRRTIKQVKARQKENATEYATISFTPVVKYDRKNGTLV
ncbi:cilia- and flagella-associated protein 68 isoform X4 [Narcine bancroftii]|uniref:cilia- and flagella-associated protein 68 isoform X4 n=1 Tax=Narcine bancroftii TaxID=1343680 RepID=UPI003831AC12